MCRGGGERLHHWSAHSPQHHHSRLHHSVRTHTILYSPPAGVHHHANVLHAGVHQHARLNHYNRLHHHDNVVHAGVFLEKYIVYFWEKFILYSLFYILDFGQTQALICKKMALKCSTLKMTPPITSRDAKNYLNSTDTNLAPEN